MKKILISLSAGILIIMLSVFSGCGFKRPRVDNKTYNKLELHCFYHNENSKCILPVKHKRLDYSGTYIKFKTASDKETLFGQLKNEDSFVEEHGDNLLFLTDGATCKYPQYVALTYKGINEDSPKYYDYFAVQQLAQFWEVEYSIEFSFPTFYVTESMNYKYFEFSEKVNSVNVDCTFEQLKNYYERLDYAFVSATEDSVTVKGYYDKRVDEKLVYEDMKLLLKYESGTVTASLAE